LTRLAWGPTTADDRVNGERAESGGPTKSLFNRSRIERMTAFSQRDTPAVIAATKGSSVLPSSPQWRALL
jgi:hypothetical protein